MTHDYSVRLRVAAVAAGIASISALHMFTPLSLLHWHNAMQQLYYFPIVIAGLSYGWRGGLAAAVFAALSNLPNIIITWKVLPNYTVDQVWEIPVFCAAGILTGVMAERGRRQRADLERTTKRLTEVYREMQDNFERMKRAERLFALGQLSAGLAHEIRNPLSSIAGAAGLLRRSPRLEPKDNECLEIISKECARLNRLLTHFLDFARPRAPRYQSTDVNAMLDSVIELAGHAVSGASVAMRKEVAPGAPPVDCDPELLQQVLLNLMINSVQAMPEGGEVLVTAQPRNGKMVIRVRDQGRGISAADRDRIFDPFFTTKETGTGLGLSVAHQIVEQHGGILTADANDGPGMTFSVILPLHSREAA